MTNYVEQQYTYDDLVGKVPEKAQFVFECLLEAIDGKLFEVDNIYYAKQLGEFVGGTIPAASLTALVKRGMLHCDGKCEGKNMYAITQEIYDYYKNVYLPTKEAYKKALTTAFWEK